MHRSSDSIAALAAALAKAQTELSNPEKSLVGTIGTDRGGEGGRTFRYAPLSSGLEIIRKALGQQQIAIVQVTAIDAASGIINLTTVLAHTSGEWIASDWPVCRLAYSAAPHRMGAALTYARRYALFTLVGIAGEDELDAPDLNPPAQKESDAGIPLGERGNGKNGFRPTLDPKTSAALRDQLVVEVAGLNSPDQAARWARTVLAPKNMLIASDARLLEVAFELRLSALEGEWSPPAAVLGSPQAPESEDPSLVRTAKQLGVVEPLSENGPCVSDDTAKPAGIDKSALLIGEARRYRDKAHIKFVASQPCLVCGRKPADPHHLTFAQVRALGRKVSDEFTVPLCRLHHWELHRARNEAGWWSKLGIDALGTALRLWKMTRSTNLPAPSARVEPTPRAAMVEVATSAKPQARRRAQKPAASGPVETVPHRA
jgi:hypothetical protein